MMCGTIKVMSVRSAIRSQCRACAKIEKTRRELNQNLFVYGWELASEYNGARKPCSFRCIKCGNIMYTPQAINIRKIKCKNCEKHVCLNCGKEFLIKGSIGIQNTRYFCYECVSGSITLKENRSEYNRLYKEYVHKEIKLRYGICCTRCGYNKCYSALEFHHRIPDEKEHDPASLISSSHKKINDIFKELDKCDLVCANCHREIHDIEKKI